MRPTKKESEETLEYLQEKYPHWPDEVFAKVRKALSGKKNTSRAELKEFIKAELEKNGFITREKVYSHANCPTNKETRRGTLRDIRSKLSKEGYPVRVAKSEWWLEGSEGVPPEWEDIYERIKAAPSGKTFDLLKECQRHKGLAEWLDSKPECSESGFKITRL